MLEKDQGGIVGTATAEQAAIRSSTPSVYVPLRFRIGGIEGMRTGAAIVGTPQGDGMVAIDVDWAPGVEPDYETWAGWAAEAGRRHAEAAEGHTEVEPQTRLVSEAALVEVGRMAADGSVTFEDEAKRSELARWIQAGRADYVVNAPFPHQP
jgi:hypothetical protein